VKPIVKLMIDIYNLDGIDFMGYTVSKDNPYTFHHLIKRCHGGKETIENGAILTKDAHEYLHLIETRDLKLYEYINNVLMQINEQCFEPLRRQLLAIDFLLKLFEEQHSEDLTCKKELIIKKKYLRR